MCLLTLLLVLFALANAATSACNDNDSAIFARQGQDFPLKFRNFGGLSVTKSAYEKRIQSEVGLSATCAACYGDAYICGWNHCKWPCVSAGAICNTCLTENSCIQKCDACTKFK